MAIKGITVSRPVIYTDGDGFEKAALITGTHESVKPGTGAVRPDEGAANIRVFSPTGKDYPRENIKFGTGPRTIRFRKS